MLKQDKKIYQICADCGTPYNMFSFGKSILSFILFWSILFIISCFFSIIGISIWLMALVFSSIKVKCPKCGSSKIIGTSSPKGKELLNKFYENEKKTND